MTIDPKVAAWFQEHRGITTETLEAWGVATNANGDVVFPYPNGEKTRPNPLRPLGDRPRFNFTKGRTPALFSCPVDPGNTTAFLCEGETDTMRLWQEQPKGSDVYGIGGIETWRKEFAEQLAPYSKVFVMLDNDQDYKVAARVDHIWLHQIRHDLGPKAQRIFLPPGVKDVCEFFEFHDLETLRLTAMKGRSSRYKPLDLTKEPPPVNWLLEGLIAKGDVTILAGGEGLGKSWFTQGLAIAVVEGWKTFLGLPVVSHGTVLYGDEENPEDVVYHRLQRLGLKTPGKMRYLWNNGIRLDREADDFLAEALDYQPDLIVLDALSRLHSLEENDRGSMGPLMNDVFKPLARETGAAVVLIHHHDKSGNGPRGSGDITASADAVIDCYPTGNPGEMKVRLRKSRRRLGGDQMVMKIVDTPDGQAQLQGVGYATTPF